jgi:mono/diheme cytochrome c family protein
MSERKASMDGDDVREPGQPETRTKSDQEIFDEQIARASGKAIVQVGGLGILLAVVLSTIALVVSVSGNTTTVTTPAAPVAGQTSTQAAQLKGDALGEQIFVSGTPGGAIGCATCHTMKAAGASGTIGPNLDKNLTTDAPADTRESVVDPNKEIVPGYHANVMPSNYATALTPQQLDAVVSYVYDSTNIKAKRAKATP